jgi:hypothetical protein
MEADSAEGDHNQKKDKGHHHHRHHHPWLDSMCRDSPLLWNSMHLLLHLTLTPLVMWVGGIGGTCWLLFRVMSWMAWQSSAIITLVLCSGGFRWLQSRTRVDQELEALRLARAITSNSAT